MFLFAFSASFTGYLSSQQYPLAIKSGYPVLRF